jgi:hypothetical protein
MEVFGSRPKVMESSLQFFRRRTGTFGSFGPGGFRSALEHGPQTLQFFLDGADAAFVPCPSCLFQLPFQFADPLTNPLGDGPRRFFSLQPAQLFFDGTEFALEGFSTVRMAFAQFAKLLTDSLCRTL